MYPHNRNSGENMNHRRAGGASNVAAEDALESQNDAMVSTLQSKIAGLKNITIAIGDEVREQNRALDAMQNSMGLTDNLLGATLNRMGVMYKSHGSMSIVYLSIFAVATFLSVYGLIRWTRS